MLKLKLQYFGHLMRRTGSLEKTLMLGKIEGRRRRGWLEMVGWHHQLNGHEFEQASGVGDGQGGLACCGSWGLKELDMTEQMKWTELNWLLLTFYSLVHIHLYKSESVKSFSHIQLFVTVACQAPLSMAFSRQKYWSGLPFPSPGDLPDPGIEPGLLHCRQILYQLSYEPVFLLVHLVL